MEGDNELIDWLTEDHEDEFIGRIAADEASGFQHPEPSPFLLERLGQLKEIEKFTHYRNVWLTKDIVIKRYTDKITFDQAIRMQKRLFSSDPLLACELLETWHNVDEWFTVAKNGGASLEESLLSGDLERKMQDVRIRLQNLGLYQSDDHPGNFVVDDAGICRVIDYESVVAVPPQSISQT
jgi:hypothetical protein